MTNITSTEEFDDWLREPEVKRIGPPGGWDNAADITNAKQYIHGMNGAINNSAQGREWLRDMAGQLYAFAISEELAAQLIISIHQPPLSNADIIITIQDCYGSMIVPPGTRSVCAPPPAKWTPAQDDDAWLEGDVRVWPKPLAYVSKDNDKKTADFFLHERPARLIHSNETLYTLDDFNLWREMSDQELAAEITATDPTDILSGAKVRGIVEAVKLKVFTNARPFEWIDILADAPHPNDTILFRNGILNLKTGELLSYTGQYFATEAPDVEYDPAAECPIWLRCLDEWLDPSFHPTLAEWMGLILTPDTSAHRILAMIGVRRGGKSTILNVMQSLVGRAHYMSRTLNDIGTEFGLTGALNAKVLIIPDAADAATANRGPALERLKAISGEDSISINRKFHDTVTSRVPTRIVIVANRHPKLLDDSGALAHREILLVFARSFEGKEDRELESKLHGELPGIANWALEGLRRLRSNRTRFTVGTQGRVAAQELAESQSPALRFSKARLNVSGDPSDMVPLSEAFRVYEEWTTEEGLSGREIRDRDAFKNDLIAALATHGVEFGRRRYRPANRANYYHGKGKPTRVFVGFKLKASS